ncbi:hypothetical protein [Maridesulfovibrio sp.]|uniref:hypothetical protein n=1 Tax=Maridesulfovibrio sp. TaxID=2795000 RepID=UPI002AA61FBB|nr:hypothetical protein [Maridesulfovibrio sp.]
MDQKNWKYKRYGRGVGKKNLPLNISYSNVEYDISSNMAYFMMPALILILIFLGSIYMKDDKPGKEEGVIGLLVEAEIINKPVLQEEFPQAPVPVEKKKPPVAPVKESLEIDAEKQNIETKKAQDSLQDKIISAKMDNATKPENSGRKLVESKNAAEVIEKKNKQTREPDREEKKAAGEIKTAERMKREKRKKGKLFLNDENTDIRRDLSSKSLLKKNEESVSAMAEPLKPKMNFYNSENEEAQIYEPVIRRHFDEQENVVALNESQQPSLQLAGDDNEDISIPAVRPGKTATEDTSRARRFARREPMKADLSENVIIKNLYKIESMPALKEQPEKNISEVQVKQSRKGGRSLDLAGHGTGESGGGSGAGQGTDGGGGYDYSDGGPPAEVEPARIDKLAGRRAWDEISDRDLPICPAGLSDVVIKSEIIQFMKNDGLGIGTTCSNDKGVFSFKGKLGIYSLTVVLNANAGIEFKNRCDFLSSAYECLVNTGGSK